MLDPCKNPFSSISITGTVVDVCARPCVIEGFVAESEEEETRYLKFFNAKAANVVLGTTAPYLVYKLPAGGGYKETIPFECNVACSVACVVERANSGTTGATASTVGLNAFPSSRGIRAGA